MKDFMISRKANAAFLSKADHAIMLIALCLAIAVTIVIARNIMYSNAKGSVPAQNETYVTSRELYTAATEVKTTETYQFAKVKEVEQISQNMTPKQFEALQLLEIRTMLDTGKINVTPPEKEVPLYTQLGLTEYEFNVLCKTVWHEYGIGTVQGQAAIVEVILNRMKSEYFPNDLVSVIGQQGQFSSAYVVAPFVEPTDDMVKAIKLAFNGSNFSGGALYYANLDLIEDNEVKAWFLSLEECAEFPGSTFFK